MFLPGGIGGSFTNGGRRSVAVVMALLHKVSGAPGSFQFIFYHPLSGGWISNHHIQISDRKMEEETRKGKGCCQLLLKEISKKPQPREPTCISLTRP